MIDVLLVIVMAAYTLSGFRHGLLVSAMSLIGFLGGGALAMWLLPHLLGDWLGPSASLRNSLILVGGVLGIAAVGQGMFGTLGAQIRRHVHFAPARAVDSALGAVASLVAISFLVWFVAGAVRGVEGPVSRAIGRSHVVNALDDVVPSQSAQLFAGFRSLMDRGGFPKVFDNLGPERILPVAPPDSALLQAKEVQAATKSLVKITGVARSCSRSQEGSGWVVAPGKVITNAHVVAGEHNERITVGGVGQSYTGRVVVFDPKRDLAVIDVPGLPAPALTLGTDVTRGAATVVAGFPQNGPLTLGASRVRQVLTATGNDIYGRPGIARSVYSLYAKVRPGNSGGPLLDGSGRVVGVVFATSLDDPNTGYALTLSEAKPVLAQSGATAPVSTGGCAAG